MPVSLHDVRLTEADVARVAKSTLPHDYLADENAFTQYQREVLAGERPVADVPWPRVVGRRVGDDFDYVTGAVLGFVLWPLWLCCCTKSRSHRHRTGAAVGIALAIAIWLVHLTRNAPHVPIWVLAAFWALLGFWAFYVLEHHVRVLRTADAWRESRRAACEEALRAHRAARES